DWRCLTGRSSDRSSSRARASPAGEGRGTAPDGPAVRVPPAGLRRAANRGTVARRCRQPKVPKIVRAIALAKTSVPYDEWIKLLMLPSRIAALTTPLRATPAKHHPARVEERGTAWARHAQPRAAA